MAGKQHWGKGPEAPGHGHGHGHGGGHGAKKQKRQVDPNAPLPVVTSVHDFSDPPWNLEEATDEELAAAGLPLPGQNIDDHLCDSRITAPQTMAAILTPQTEENKAGARRRHDFHRPPTRVRYMTVKDLHTGMYLNTRFEHPGDRVEVHLDLEEQDIQFLQKINKVVRGGEVPALDKELEEEDAMWMMDMWEKATGREDPINFSRAIEICRERGVFQWVLYTPYTVKILYDWWRHRRVMNRKPLLRMFWATPDPADINLLTCFRPKLKDKKQLRAHKKSLPENWQRFMHMDRDLKSSMEIVKELIARERMKTFLSEVDQLNAETQRMRVIDPTYVHPGQQQVFHAWRYMCRDRDKTFRPRGRYRNMNLYHPWGGPGGFPLHHLPALSMSGSPSMHGGGGTTRRGSAAAGLSLPLHGGMRGGVSSPHSAAMSPPHAAAMNFGGSPTNYSGSPLGYAGASPSFMHPHPFMQGQFPHPHPSSMQHRPQSQQGMQQPPQQQWGPGGGGMYHSSSGSFAALPKAAQSAGVKSIKKEERAPAPIQAPSASANPPPPAAQSAGGESAAGLSLPPLAHPDPPGPPRVTAPSFPPGAPSGPEVGGGTGAATSRQTSAPPPPQQSHPMLSHLGGPSMSPHMMPQRYSGPLYGGGGGMGMGSPMMGPQGTLAPPPDQRGGGLPMRVSSGAFPAFPSHSRAGRAFGGPAYGPRGPGGFHGPSGLEKGYTTFRCRTRWGRGGRLWTDRRTVDKFKDPHFGPHYQIEKEDFFHRFMTTQAQQDPPGSPLPPSSPVPGPGPSPPYLASTFGLPPPLEPLPPPSTRPKRPAPIPLQPQGASEEATATAAGQSVETAPGGGGGGQSPPRGGRVEAAAGGATQQQVGGGGANGGPSTGAQVPLGGGYSVCQPAAPVLPSATVSGSATASACVSGAWQVPAPGVRDPNKDPKWQAWKCAIRGGVGWEGERERKKVKLASFEPWMAMDDALFTVPGTGSALTSMSDYLKVKANPLFHSSMRLCEWVLGHQQGSWLGVPTKALLDSSSSSSSAADRGYHQRLATRGVSSSSASNPLPPQPQTAAPTDLMAQQQQQHQQLQGGDGGERGASPLSEGTPMDEATAHTRDELSLQLLMGHLSTRWQTFKRRKIMSDNKTDHHGSSSRGVQGQQQHLSGPSGGGVHLGGRPLAQQQQQGGQQYVTQSGAVTAASSNASVHVVQVRPPTASPRQTHNQIRAPGVVQGSPPASQARPPASVATRTNTRQGSRSGLGGPVQQWIAPALVAQQQQQQHSQRPPFAQQGVQAQGRGGGIAGTIQQGGSGNPRLTLTQAQPVGPASAIPGPGSIGGGTGGGGRGQGGNAAGR
uniref:Enhancer of polycomb-like protein n=1 Tax=Chromera velia CCMP2878 TaxID=1169474 RepID=A0A0G4HWS0_9ALVE|eukprot:Cvel_1452.t1-p1 / transcript=Cvel_1452.t1 / gene=Cvel_1452 / organism=Chromera_velia_CCMP2878 / gene_product=hypothetical protein / transcript_product=hypothetical protein / location=Cvel_scaffold51:13738-24980(-) / protein_length=1340 / sequence_SO=supercontig / SO=protein_coding / is_pseudo=false